MPNRILREGIVSSPRMAKLGWPEEVFYRRLMSVVDDFGRFSADPGMLRSACYPRQLSKVSDSDIGKWLQVIADAALVRVYPASDGERYLELLNFNQQVRAKRSKYPEPLSTCVADAEQIPANAHLGVFVSVFEDGGDTPARKRAPPPVSRPEDVTEQTWLDWCALRKRKKADVSVTTLEKAREEAAKAALPLEAFLRIWCLRGSQGLEAAWLRADERRSFADQKAAVARVTAPSDDSARTNAYLREQRLTPEQKTASDKAAALALAAMGRVQGVKAA